MSFQISARNPGAILGASPSAIEGALTALFRELGLPDANLNLRDVYLSNLDRRLKRMRQSHYRTVSSFDYFGRAAVEAGMVQTMLAITSDTRGDPLVAVNAVYAFNALADIIGLANAAERLAFTKEFVEHGGVRICLDAATPNPDKLVGPRHAAVICMRALAGDGYLGELLSLEETAEVMSVMCAHILSGPALFIAQMMDPDTTFQSRFCFDGAIPPPSAAARYAPRYYAMGQENAARVLHALLCRRNPPTQKFRTAILKHDPLLVDALFDCLSVTRPEWYPESDVVSLTSEVLAMFFGGSVGILHGASLEPKFGDAKLAKEYKEEKQALREASMILLARPAAINALIIAWLSVEDEKWETIHTNFHATGTRYLADCPRTAEDFLSIFEHRGNSRTGMLRVVATLVAVVPNDLPNDTIVSLLHIGSSASQKLFPMSAIRKTSDQYDYLDHNFETFRTPLSVQGTGEVMDAPTQIAPEGVLGPTLLVRLLTILAQRNKLNTPLKKLPVGALGIALAEVRTILKEDSIKTFLALAQKRAKERKDEGTKRYKTDNEPDFAGLAYYSAAELAAALVLFDEATGGKWGDVVKDARAEVVMSLGNAAEMALNLKQWQKALLYATAAVYFWDKVVGGGHVVGAAYLEKNKRRVERARAGYL